ncbi:GNAT family N-acetyltransferase [Flavobacterium sp.]|jgi:RimJ/RimL family protein N-acetyltransferase|uniref:GNAT family N-acetyltransferase n=1 Tax=Flavobacterium sp. TaxID=239 RepID=UPI0037C03C72
MNFNFEEKYILENEVVRLEPLTMSHFDSLIEFSINEPEIWSFNANGPDSPENLKKYLDFALKQRENKLEYPFAVFDKKSNKFVGSTRFYNIVLEGKTLEIGFTWYGKQFQGTAINKNCKYLLLTFAFENMKMERVGFRANNANERSKNAMKSIGCVEEGILRSFRTDAFGNRIDAVVLSIIKSEWYSGAKENLKNKI